MLHATRIRIPASHPPWHPLQIDEPMNPDTMNREQLNEQLTRLEEEFAAHKRAGLNLDLTRGKPSIAQLELSSALDGALDGDFVASDGSDTRGYGAPDGIPEARAMGAQLMGLSPEQVIVGGNSSLTLMYLYLMHCVHFGPGTGGGHGSGRGAAGRRPGHQGYLVRAQVFQSLG